MHFQQSVFWAEFKRKVGNNVLQVENIHLQKTKVPKLNKFVGYIPPVKKDDLNLTEIYEAAKAEKCVFVTVDFENLNTEKALQSKKYKLIETKSIRLPKNCIVDLTKSEDELFNSISRGVRYNIRYADKNGVSVRFGDSEKDFKFFLESFLATKNRQKFYGRDENYLSKLFNFYKEYSKNNDDIKLIFANAFLGEEPLVGYLLIAFEDTVYYPYGGASLKHSKLKPTYKAAWEVIKWSKDSGYRNFDWMGLEEDYEHGFSAFKVQFGGEIVTYLKSVDIVIDTRLYKLLSIGRKMRARFKILKNIT